jgi:hypothetical protein
MRTMELECKNKYIINKQKMLPYAIFWKEFSVFTDAIRVILRRSYNAKRCQNFFNFWDQFNREASDGSH